MKQRRPQADFRRFRRLVTEQIGATLNDYGFKESGAHVLDPGMWVLYRNATTEVQVYFEYRCGMSIAIRRLIQTDDTITYGDGYDLEELLLARAPDRFAARSHEQPRLFDEHFITTQLKKGATDLKLYADDVLRGYFYVFELLSRLRLETKAWSRRAVDLEFIDP